MSSSLVNYVRALWFLVLMHMRVYAHLVSHRCCAYAYFVWDGIHFKLHPRCVSGLDAEETLVVVVSKTFSTAETMLNARTMRQWLWDRMSNGEPSAEVGVVVLVLVIVGNGGLVAR